MDIPILYEDNHLLVVEKPRNMLVQADRTGDDDLLTILKEDIKVRHNKPGNVYLALVHRLDRPVGGVMVFAKTSKAASRLSDVIRRQALERKYYAVVRGTPEQRRATLTHYLRKDNRRNIVHTVSANHKQGKKSILKYETMAKSDGLSLLSVQLQTGRAHQIRVQLSASGTPLYGDQKYGQNVNKPGQQIALWAHAIRFKHPTKDEFVTVECSPPEEHPWHLWPNLT